MAAKKKKPAVPDKRRINGGAAMSLSKGAAALILLILTALVYLKILSNGFVYDDPLQILDNTWIRSWGNVLKPFASHAWGYSDSPTNYYRPLIHVVYTFIYAISGLKPWGYHLVSLVVNAMVSVAAFFVIRKALSLHKAADVDRAPVTAAAFAGALIFAMHPVHVEAVAFASAMGEVFFALFGLTALYLYMDSNGGYGKKYALSAVFFFIALLFKETAVAFLVLMAACDYVLGKGLRPRRYAVYAAVFVVYFIIRFNAIGGLAPVNETRRVLTGYEYAINAVPLFGGYFMKFIAPVNLRPFYVFHPIGSLFELKWIAGAVFVIAYAAAVLFSRGIVRFALVWAALPLLPVLYLKALGDSVFAERYMYLSTAGIALLAAAAVLWAIEKKPLGEKTGFAVWGLVSAVAVVFAAGTVQRTYIWNDSLTLWQDTVRKVPDGAVPYYNLGNANQESGNMEEAKAHYLKSIELDPRYVAPYNNVGTIYHGEGKMDIAIRYYLDSMKLKPENAVIRKNLGAAYLKVKRLDDAVRELKEAVRLKPGYAEAHYLLGNVYVEKKSAKEAEPAYMEAIRTDPAYADAYNNLGLIYMDSGRLGEAEKVYIEAIRLTPRSYMPYNNIGNVYMRRGEFERAAAAFMESIRLNPAFTGARYSLSYVYGRMGKTYEAEVEFTEARRIDAAAAAARAPRR